MILFRGALLSRGVQATDCGSGPPRRTVGSDPEGPGSKMSLAGRDNPPNALALRACTPVAEEEGEVGRVYVAVIVEVGGVAGVRAPGAE